MKYSLFVIGIGIKWIFLLDFFFSKCFILDFDCLFVHFQHSSFPSKSCSANDSSSVKNILVEQFFPKNTLQEKISQGVSDIGK